MSELTDYTKTVGITAAVDTDGQHRARLTVAGHALDAADCRELPDMLGLVPVVESPEGDPAVVP